MPSRHPALARSPVLAGRSDAELDALNARMRPRRFAAGEELRRAGAPSDSTWLITGGLVHWFVPTTEGANDLLLRLRKGDVIGAQDAVSGEPRSATVIASIPTSTLELSAEDLIDLASLEGTVGAIVATARSASPRPVSFADRRLSFAGALTAADDLAAENAAVLIQGPLQAETLEVLVDQVDRVVALAGTAAEAEQLGKLSAAAKGHRLEVMLVGDEAAAVGRSSCAESGIAPVRICARQEELALSDPHLCWLARHFTRTTLGIALGAGEA